MDDKGILGGLHPFMKLLLLVLLMFGSALVVLVIGMLVGTLFFGTEILSGMGADPANVAYLRYVQIISHLGLFITASLLFAFLVGQHPMAYLQGQRSPNGRSLWLSAAIMLAAVPLVYYLGYLNQSLSLPESFKALESWMRQMEDSAEEITRLLLDVSSWQGLLFNLFMIAVIPAIGEEFIFRGALQRIFRQWTGSTHVAVLLAAVLFSAMHLQFFGFLPRLLLGILLGYMMVYTKNIWVPVFAHFFNNAAAVILYYGISQSGSEFDMDSVGEMPMAWLPALVSLGVLLFLFSLLKMRRSTGEYKGERPLW